MEKRKYIVDDEKELVIGVAEKDDVQKIIDYLMKIGGESDFLTFGKGEINLTIEEEEKIIEQCKESNNSLFIIAEIDGIVVSTLNYRGGKRKRIAHTGEFGISVLKDYWGLGIASRMMEYMIDWAKKSEVVRKINLRVRHDNVKAMKLYKKFGFVEEGRITRDFFIKGKFYDSICMGLEID